jgi:nitrite reductase/ring-hydroxylating ferredoxin subunit/uncharacterized membrane protein
MKSKASFKSHPIHPMLVAFPIAFFIGAFLFDVLSLILNKPHFLQTGYYLGIAGIIGALVAAVPGMIDYFYTVPPHSSAKKRATKHALINITNILLFTAAVFYRRSEAVNHTIVIALEGMGIVLLSVAGWLGGTLVYRNQIGVDPRYAHAGKWKELFTNSESLPIEVAKIDELKVDQMKLVHIKNKRIVVAKTENGYVAFDDQCTHKGGSLAGGSMICGTVQCPWHGAQFNVNTGEVKAGPAKERISTYPVAESDGKIFLVATHLEKS